MPGRGSHADRRHACATELTRDEADRAARRRLLPQGRRLTERAANRAPRRPRAAGAAVRAGRRASPGTWRRSSARQARALGGRSARAGKRPTRHAFVHPTAVLFNGGVFKASALEARVLEVLNGWLAADGGEPAKELEGADLDLAVARGAAYYGWVRRGHGVRIRGGTARAYYVGVESGDARGARHRAAGQALCVAPFGMEEGTEADVPPQEFGLVVGEPARFRFFGSSVRREDQVGGPWTTWTHSDELEELAPIETDAARRGAEARRARAGATCTPRSPRSARSSCAVSSAGGHGTLEARVQRAHEGVAGGF